MLPPFPGPQVPVKGYLSRTDTVRWLPCARTFAAPSEALGTEAADSGYTVSLAVTDGRVLRSAPVCAPV